MDTIKHNSWYLDVSLRQFLAPASHGTRAKENLRIGSKRSDIPRRGSPQRMVRWIRRTFREGWRLALLKNQRTPRIGCAGAQFFVWQKSFQVISQYFVAPEKSKVCVRCKAMCVKLNDRLYCSIFSISSPEPPTCIWEKDSRFLDFPGNLKPLPYIYIYIYPIFIYLLKVVIFHSYIMLSSQRCWVHLFEPVEVL